MKVLITGATGLVGKELVALLLQEGITVHYLTTSKSKLEDKTHYKGFYWNPGQGYIDDTCLDGVTSIIHLAGATVSKRWTQSYKQEIIESRTLTSQLLFKTLKNTPHQVKQIVSASAIGIYKDSLTEIYTEESKNFDDTFLSNVVQKWEDHVSVFKVLGIQVCFLRIGLVLSSHGGALPEIIKPIKMGVGAPLGSGKQVQSWIHIQDLVALFLFAVQNNLSGVYNAVAPNPVTQTEFTRVFAQALKKPLVLPRVPRWVLALVLGEMHQLLFSSQHVSSEKTEREGFKFRYRDLNKAADNLV